MSKVKTCLKCNEIKTFCECENPIYDKDEYLEYVKNTMEYLVEELYKYAKIRKLLKKVK